MMFDELRVRGGGRVIEHAPFGARTTYRVGGTVRALVTLSRTGDLDDLGPYVASCKLPIFVLGNGSNLLVAEGEHEVLGLHLSGEFSQLNWSEDGDDVVVEAGGGLDLPVAARRLSAEGITGFEWAVGVPGTFGGAAVMNAGGHGDDMAASVQAVHTWSGQGRRTWSMQDLRFAYRSSALGPGDVVTSVVLRLRRGDALDAQATMRDVVRWRREHQPGGANAGSVFRNPPGDYAGRLIEGAGCRSLRVGSAVVSEKHANFIIADPGGSANDVFALIDVVRGRVLQHSGITLQCEHRFLGFEDAQ